MSSIEANQHVLKIGNLIARVPVIQGGMGVGISLSKLAGTVAAEGGIGVISTAQIGFREPDFDTDPIGANLRAIGQEIRKARELAKGGIIGVNIMVATRKYEEYVKAAVAAGVDLIISGAGLPMNLPALVEGTKNRHRTHCIEPEIGTGYHALLEEKIQSPAGFGGG